MQKTGGIIYETHLSPLLWWVSVRMLKMHLVLDTCIDFFTKVAEVYQLFPPTSRKGPILAPRPLILKRTSLDLLLIMSRDICGTLPPSIYRPRPRFLTRPPSLSLGVYSLSSRTRAFNHERNIIAISPSSPVPPATPDSA
jgi:hypothetical protein